MSPALVKALQIVKNQPAPVGRWGWTDLPQLAGESYGKWYRRVTREKRSASRHTISRCVALGYAEQIEVNGKFSYRITEEGRKALEDAHAA